MCMALPKLISIEFEGDFCEKRVKMYSGSRRRTMLYSE